MLKLFFGKTPTTRIPTEQANESVNFFLWKSIGLLQPLVMYQKYFSNEEMREIFDIIKIPVIDLAIDFFLKRSNQQTTKILLNNISNIIKNSNIFKIFYDNKTLEKAKLRNIYDNPNVLKKQMEALLKNEINKFLPHNNQVKTTQQMMHHYNPLQNKTDLKIKQKEMQKVRKKIGELKDKIQQSYDNPVLPALLPEDEMEVILEMNKRNRDMEKGKIEVFTRIPEELEKLKKELNFFIKEEKKKKLLLATIKTAYDRTCASPGKKEAADTGKPKIEDVIGLKKNR